MMAARVRLGPRAGLGGRPVFICPRGGCCPRARWAMAAASASTTGRQQPGTALEAALRQEMHSIAHLARSQGEIKEALEAGDDAELAQAYAENVGVLQRKRVRAAGLQRQVDAAANRPPRTDQELLRALFPDD